MPPLSHGRRPDAEQEAESGRSALSRSWRIGTPLVGIVAGTLFVISAVNSEGNDLRREPVTDLASLVRSESENVAEKQRRANDLTTEVDQLSANIDDEQVREARSEASAMEDPAGFREVSGEGLTVTLSDAPAELRANARDINFLVVHQQDIQAVVNAMWAGGAEAIMIQGQRIISTTGIKCAGNSVELQGIPYPQPFVITAIGDPESMQLSIENDHDIGLYRRDAADPEISIGWNMQVEDRATAPAYSGLRDLSYAEPLQPA